LHINAGNMFGGVETFLVTLARSRDLCPDMESAFALCFGGRLSEELTAAGVSVHNLRPTRAGRPWTVLMARARLARLMAIEKYDIAVCHQPWAQGIFGDVASRRTGYVAHFHGPPGKGWTDWLAARQKPRMIVAPSRDSLEQCRRLLPGIRAEVLNYPLPTHVTDSPALSTAERAEFRAKLGVAPDEVVVLQASRIEAWKGPDLTLKALARLRDVPGWRLWLAGGVQRPKEQILADELHRIAAANGIAGRVSFLGERKDVSYLMRAADIYCQGNRGAEGFSLSFLEASFCGLPVVTTDIGGAREMIDAETGVLVPPSEDATALSEALRILICDPSRRTEMGKSAHQKAVRLCDAKQQLNRLAKWLGEAARTSQPTESGR
jgi:glycosyltransferase involved in cell wall biosynthesis